ncbi:MAG: hypothetical protein AVDCRST_MAG69-2890, partial [uncultured Solirubrobacteraceae bacterium]
WTPSSSAASAPPSTASPRPPRRRPNIPSRTRAWARRSLSTRPGRCSPASRPTTRRRTPSRCAPRTPARARRPRTSGIS